MLLETLRRHWWIPVLRGVAAIIFAVIAFTHPVMAAATLVLLFGDWVLIDGSFRRYSLLESARWCGGANLYYRLVCSDNGRSGDHFWLSLAQLADTGSPLIRGKPLQPYHPKTADCFACRRSSIVRFANFLCD